MTDNLYRDELLDIVRESAAQKKVRKPDLVIEDFNSLCGDKLVINLKLDSGRIVDYGFEGSGCLISQASAYLLKDKIKGKTVAEVKAITDEEVLDVLGIPAISPSRIKCALMAVRALREKM